MSGFFGTTASYNSDLSLITSIVFFAMGAVAYFQARSRKYKPHANLMVWGGAAELDPDFHRDDPHWAEDPALRTHAHQRTLRNYAPRPCRHWHGHPASDDLHRDPDEMGQEAPAPPHSHADARGNAALAADHAAGGIALYVVAYN